MRRILVIEDDTMMAESIQDHLQAIGFEVVIADSKKAAYQALEVDPNFFAMLIDGWMDGATDTCDVVRDFRETYQGHMIAMSSNNDTRQKQMAAGCSHEIWNKHQAAAKVIQLHQRNPE